jgi:asparagine synthase (glutamine-hydrolysing)
MCGIAGLVTLGQESLTENVATVIGSMCKSIVHRGPDDHGTYITEKVALGFQRLSILDLSLLGHQPMFDASGRYAIVFNGEIYNFKELHKELIPEFQPKSHSDTEILLQLFIQFGPPVLDRLNGMFAFAIWDNQEKSLTIVRDRLGIKPVYYALHNGCLYFASEIKALHAAGIPKILNKDYMEELLCFRYVAGEATPYKGILKLLPGHFLTIEKGDFRVMEWWSYADVIRKKENQMPADGVNWFKETFDQSVDYRMIADVPVGILLSGGLDSSSIAASLGVHNRDQINTFTVRFVEEKFDEGSFAKQVADQYNMRYNDLFVPPADLFRLSKEATMYLDEPVYHFSELFLMAISRFAKDKVTILLSGEGGDETLGGYVRYTPLRYKRLLSIGFVLAPLLNLIPVKGRWKKLLRFLRLGNFDKFILYNACEILPHELKDFGFKVTGKFEYRQRIIEKSKEVYKDNFRRVMYYDMHTHLSSLLDRNDHMTMAASIECRVPFLDYRLVEMLGAVPTKKLLPDGKPKSLLRRSFSKRLPQSLLEKSKWGFGVPWNQYYRTIPEFKKYMLELAEHPLVLENFSTTDKISAGIDAFLKGDEKFSSFFVHLANVCIWYDMNFEKAAA